MNEMFLTVISAVLILIFTQLFLELVMKPLKQYLKVVSKIDNKLKYYANRVSDSNMSKEEFFCISKLIREMSCDLETSYKQIFGRSALKVMGVIVSQVNVATAATELIGLSNSVSEKLGPFGNYKRIERIRECLNIGLL